MSDKQVDIMRYSIVDTNIFGEKDTGKKDRRIIDWWKFFDDAASSEI